MTRKEKIEKIILLSQDSSSSSKEEIKLLLDDLKKDYTKSLNEAQERVIQLEVSLRNEIIDKLID